jgi:hypothetical protein
MYAYCQGDPVNFVDPGGCLAFPGQIHNIVVDAIVATHPSMAKEQTIKYENGTWGRADLVLYNSKTNTAQIWDVKRDNAKQIASGVKQVGKYLTGTWKNAPRSNTTLVRGGKIQGTGTMFLVRNIGGETYYISYRYAGQGVIAYDYTKILDDKFVRNVATGAGAAALAAAVALVMAGSGGAAAPVIPFALAAAEKLLNAA